MSLFIVGISSIVLGFVSRFAFEPGNEVRAILAIPVVRHLVFFLLVFSATRNVLIAAITSTVFVFAITVASEPAKAIANGSLRVDFVGGDPPPTPSSG
jgi:hypothetical protein